MFVIARSIHCLHKPTQMILKINGGKLELRRDNGSLERTIASSHVVDADMNDEETHIALVLDNGRCELRRINGSLERTLGTSKAVGVKWSGDDIAVELENGKTELRKISGSLIRTI